MKQIKINGLSIGYQQKGQGDTLVLLHGGVSDSRYWSRQFDSFSDHYHVIAWDAPGCGLSDDPLENFSLSDYADTLAAFLKQLGVNQAHVLGISFGGGLAIAFCHQHPQMLKSLILVSAYAGWAGSLPPEEVEKRLEKGRKQSQMDPDDVVDLWLPSLFSSPPSETVINEVKMIISEFHPKGSEIMLEAFAKADLREVLSQIDVPTLLLYGADDVRSPLEVARELDKKISTSKLEIITGVGHLVDKEAPAVFETQVRKFIREHT